MIGAHQNGRVARLGFVSTRIAGTDGVSLEIEKWTAVLEGMGIECFFIAGECDRDEDRSFIIPEAHFEHPDILDITERSFGSERRTPQLTDDILALTRTCRDKLAQAIKHFNLMAICAENALTIPMNIPLGLAIVQEVQEMGLGCVAHHHDFYWERDRFLVSAVDDYLHYAFPPALPQMQHVVISSQAGEEFSRRTGLSCRIIPNVMDFSNPPPPPDDHARRFRETVGLAEDDILVLQPTRVIERKGIEHSIELCRRIDKDRAVLVITHESGDEGHGYQQRVREFAEIMEVKVIFASEFISKCRGVDAAGRPFFSLGDAFSQADLVTYPSEYEGFGNAFLEAIYYRCPIICNRYSIYRTDIEPFGFRAIAFDGYLTAATVMEARRVLESETIRREMVEHNYDVGLRFFSYEILRQEFEFMLRRPHNIQRMYARNWRQGPRDEIVKSILGG